MDGLFLILIVHGRMSVEQGEEKGEKGGGEDLVLHAAISCCSLSFDTREVLTSSLSPFSPFSPLHLLHYSHLFIHSFIYICYIKCIFLLVMCFNQIHGNNFLISQ